MSIKSIIRQTKTLLEGQSTFKNRVTIWDYSILDVPAPHAVVLHPGRVVQVIDAYGNSWLRTVEVFIEAYVFYQVAKSTESTERLLDIVDAIDTLLIENYHLGVASTVVQRAVIVGVSTADILTRGEAANKWFHVTMALAVDEPQLGTGGAQ